MLLVNVDILFRKSGKYYIGNEHDSLVLNANKNTYNWYSKQEYGNTINFIQNEKGLDFIDAVKYLNNEEFQVANFKEEKLFMIHQSINTKRKKIWLFHVII